MTRIAAGSNSAVASDQASITAVKNTFLIDVAATQSAIKSIGLVKGFLATAIAAVDNISNRNARMFELAIMGANGTNTATESAAIDAEAEALIDDMLLSAVEANYKGKTIFDGGYDLHFSLGGRGQKSSVYIGTINVMEIGLYHYGTQNLIVKPSDGLADADAMTSILDVFQEEINKLRTELASGYAVVEQAQSTLTDLNTEYKISVGAVDDLNFSAEAALLAKNQMLQDAANAMLAQANQAQSGLIALIS
jgi:flagellin